MEKILVIDDSKITQMLVAEILTGKYELDFQDDGLAGITAVKRNPPDLILLDIHLPKMDGYDVCRTLKMEEKTREIPILFITSMDSALERVKGFEAGAEDYVVKPFYLEELLARVKVHLALRRAKQQAVELERLNVFKEMAVALNHEINNPLTTVYAYLHVLQRELSDFPENIQQSLLGIHKELGRIRQITERLAFASKAEKTCYNGGITMIDLQKI
ncbi:MAG: response regulator [Geobacteraceae bacterium]|nr:MAG: response regulator [Geobacteraceae bacterium]